MKCQFTSLNGELEIDFLDSKTLQQSHFGLSIPHYITFHYSALHYITLHYIKLMLNPERYTL